LKEQYLHNEVEKAYPFIQGSKDRLNDAVYRLLDLYAKCVTRGDKALAKQQLKLHQRENIAWERDTVWRQMIAQERRGENEGEPTAIASLLKKPGPGLFFIPTPLGTIRVTKKMIYKIVAGLIFVTLLNVPVVEVVEANRCFAILMFCTFLWATEVRLLCQVLSICMLIRGVLHRLSHYSSPLCLYPYSWSFYKSSGTNKANGSILRVPPSEEDYILPGSILTYTYRWVFSVMFSPTIMLLIGGFTISSALSKTNIDRVLITKVLSLAGSKPSTVLLAFMGVSCFASMWIR
jgi:phosphate transporter